MSGIIHTATALKENSAIKAADSCFHCGEECAADALMADEKKFCCAGCRTVYELLQENNLCAYYNFDERAGLSFKRARPGRFEFLDDDSVRRALIQYRDGVTARTTFRLPQIHCASCIWLLENLYRINPAILRTEVNFLKKEIAITFREQEIPLSEIAALLTKLGYAPDLRLEQMTETGKKPETGERELYLKIGLAGFAFGNVMLFSFPDYLDGAGTLGAHFKILFGWLSIALSTPALLYSASGYFISSWYALRQRQISLDVPVALGITALYARSVFDILSGAGTGYLDSFNGLVFFLLIGRLFQKKTFDSLSFDRNYAAYFPLSVTVRKDSGESVVPVSKLTPGEIIIVRHRELIPADSVLISNAAQIDYSFVTGESEPVEVKSGETVYAGGRVTQASAELGVVREVSHSYLTQLWNDAAFHKEKPSSLVDLSDAFGKYFTLIVSLIAVAAALWHLPDVDQAINVFTAVLIIACPCALTLAAPFTLGAAVAIFGKAKFYLKNVGVVTGLATLDTLVFDKTGTLTHSDRAEVHFAGEPLTDEECELIAACLKHSTHPLSRQILKEGLGVGDWRLKAGDFHETAGCGIEARVNGHRVALGSAAWIAERTGHKLNEPRRASLVCVEIDGAYRGCFRAGSVYRAGLKELLASLRAERELFLLSGDNDHERGALQAHFDETHLAFHQSPEDKLRFVNRLQTEGRTVGMIGDGLNDAGALKQSHVGIALAEDTSAFSPACDAILAAENFERLPVYLGFARYALRVLLAAFLLSLVYNVVGLSFAVTGKLSPLVTAIFMPLSSLSVVAVAWGAMKIREREIAQPEGNDQP
jgi:Cu+-exporting ATPase